MRGDGRRGGVRKSPGARGFTIVHPKRSAPVSRSPWCIDAQVLVGVSGAALASLVPADRWRIHRWWRRASQPGSGS